MEHMDKVRPHSGREGGLGHVRREAYLKPHKCLHVSRVKPPRGGPKPRPSISRAQQVSEESLFQQFGKFFQH